MAIRLWLGKCWVCEVIAALHLPVLKQKGKSCHGSCVRYQWYLSVLLFFTSNCEELANCPYYSDPLPWEVLWIYLPLWWRWDKEGASPALLPQAKVAYCLLFISPYPDHQDHGNPHIKMFPNTSTFLRMSIHSLQLLLSCRMYPRSPQLLIFTGLPPWVASPTSLKCRGDVYCPKSCARHDQVLAHSTYLQYSCAPAVLCVREVAVQALSFCFWAVSCFAGCAQGTAWACPL